MRVRVAMAVRGVAIGVSVLVFVRTAAGDLMAWHAVGVGGRRDITLRMIVRRIASGATRVTFVRVAAAAVV